MGGGGGLGAGFPVVHEAAPVISKITRWSLEINFLQNVTTSCASTADGMAPVTMQTETASFPLTVVVPAYNEAGNLPALVEEIVAALRGVTRFEIVCIDDRSSDGTVAALQALKPGIPELRILRHRERSGQSTAIHNGVAAARGEWIATLDGDGQNDPADIPSLLQARDAADGDVKLFAGWRVNRRDSGSKRWASKWANAIRARALHDDTPDTGCGTKLFERAAFLSLPYFDHMHRYLPALMQRAG